MRNLLVTSLTGDNAIAAAVPALVVRVENIYEAGDQYFAVDANADWSGGPVELSVRDASDRRPQYDVAGFVAHERTAHRVDRTADEKGANANAHKRSGGSKQKYE